MGKNYQKIIIHRIEELVNCSKDFSIFRENLNQFQPDLYQKFMQFDFCFFNFLAFLIDIFQVEELTVSDQVSKVLSFINDMGEFEPVSEFTTESQFSFFQLQELLIGLESIESILIEMQKIEEVGAPPNLTLGIVLSCLEQTGIEGIDHNTNTVYALLKELNQALSLLRNDLRSRDK